MKKLIALVLALALVLASCAVAFADTITLSVHSTGANDENVVSETYTAYKIFDVIKASGANGNNADSTLGAGDTQGYSYTISTSSPWYNTVAGLSDSDGAKYFDLTTIASDATKKTVTLRAAKYNTDTYAKEIAGKLEAAISSLTLTQNTDYWVMSKSTSNTVDPITVPAGYYLIKSTLGSNLIAATTNIAITEKNDYPSVDKTQKDEDDSTYTDDALDLQIGDTVQYQIAVYVPAGANGDITVKDTMSAGLTPGSVDSITAVAYPSYDSSTNAFSGTADDSLATTTDWEKAAGATGTNVTYQITIHPTAKTKGQYIQLTFSATINASAVVDTGKKNEVELTYKNYKQTDHVDYKIYRTGVIKYDEATGTVDSDNVLTAATAGGTVTYLSGAEFDLYDKDNTKVNLYYDSTYGYYRPALSGETAVKITSVDNAVGVIIRGLDMDENRYYLKETTAPAGYNLPASTFPLTLEEDDTKAQSVTVGEKAKVKVPNAKGTLLPSTGGIGTTIFYILGGLLVVGAAVILVARRKASN